MSDTTWIIICVVIAIVCSVISALIAIAIRKGVVEKKIGSAEEKARHIIDDAIKTAESKKKKLFWKQRKKT